ncbi:MAG: gliding motility lipoprotein GldH [Flavobacteriales bacterium]
MARAMMEIKTNMALRINNLFLFVALSAGLGSCGEASFYEENTPIDGTNWKINDVKAFTVNIDDTVQHYDFFIDLRHTESYPYSNIFLFMTYTLPDGKRVVDSVGYNMQDAENRWLGNHSGSLITHRVLVKQNGRFPRKGRYVISLRHAMYDDPLVGVCDIGITLRKKEKKS